MKILIKSITFIFLFIIIWKYTFSVLWLEKNPIYYFYKEPKNSLDVIYIGSSNTFWHFNSTLAYKKYGFTTGFLSSEGQNFITTKYLIEEAKKYQNPKLFIVDIAKVADDLENIQDSDIRKVTDSMKNSSNKYKLISLFLRFSKIPKNDYVNYYFSFLTYHNKWKTISECDFMDNKSLFKGYLFYGGLSFNSSHDKEKWDDNLKSMKKQNKKILIDLIKYIKNNHINVLFVIPNRTFYRTVDEKIENMYVQINDAVSIIKNNNLNVINFNTVDDFKIDYSKDFLNLSHLNVYGATKYTMYFSNYLKNNYDLKDHRGNKKYKSWDDEYNRFQKAFNNLTGKNLDNYIYNNFKQDS